MEIIENNEKEKQLNKIEVFIKEVLFDILTNSKIDYRNAHDEMKFKSVNLDSYITSCKYYLYNKIFITKRLIREHFQPDNDEDYKEYKENMMIKMFPIIESMNMDNQFDFYDKFDKFIETFN